MNADAATPAGQCQPVAEAWDERGADDTLDGKAGDVPCSSPTTMTQATGSEAASTRLSHHYDSSRDIVLRFEFVGAASFKVGV
jgi:hypothetical protein